MPAYNAGNFILDAVNAVLAQSYQSWELIIVNDGSTDDTQHFLNQLNDPRIAVFNKSNNGAAAARNSAYQQAIGDYILFFDADDFLPPKFLEEQLKSIAGVEDAVAISSWGRFYDNDIHTFQHSLIAENIETFKDWICEYWYKANPMTNPGRVLMPRAIAEAAGLWNENLSLNDDLEYFTRVFLASKRLIINNAAVFYYRSGVNGLSANRSPVAQQSLFLSLQLALGKALAAFPGHRQVQKSSANMWQSVVYEFYPECKDLAAKAEAEVVRLGGSNIAFPAGGITKLLAAILGWKLTKRLKQTFN